MSSRREEEREGEEEGEEGWGLLARRRDPPWRRTATGRGARRGGHCQAAGDWLASGANGQEQAVDIFRHQAVLVALG